MASRSTSVPRVDLRLWLAMAFALPVLAGEGPEQGRWSLEVRTEPSTVESGGWSGSWSTNRIQAECRFPTAGGFFLAGESQRRGEDSNRYFTGGGFRRLGDWTLAVRAGVGVNPVFVPRHMVEGTVSRRLAGTLVGQLSFQDLDFPAAKVHLGGIGATWYAASGEFEAGLKTGRNGTYGSDIRVVVLRGLWNRSESFSLGCTAAAGRNLFGTLSIPVEGGRGWQGNVHARIQILPRTSLRIDLGEGREHPSFRQRTIALSCRREF